MAENGLICPKKMQLTVLALVQVEVDWEAWQELPLHLRLETMVNPDWLPYQEFVNRRLAVMNGAQDCQLLYIHELNLGFMPLLRWHHCLQCVYS